MYKICLSDNSFIIADENYILNLFNGIKRKKLSLKNYLSTNKYEKYYLVDKINGKTIKRTFTIEETDLDIPIGSRIKLAKDIQVGDLIQGTNGEPRVVNELHTGNDEMFEINVNNKSYIVNGGHILALINKDNGEHLEMPVNIFMHMDSEFQSHYAMEVEQL